MRFSERMTEQERRDYYTAREAAPLLGLDVRACRKALALGIGRGKPGGLPGVRLYDRWCIRKSDVASRTFRLDDYCRLTESEPADVLARIGAGIVDGFVAPSGEAFIRFSEVEAWRRFRDHWRIARKHGWIRG